MTRRRSLRRLLRRQAGKGGGYVQVKLRAFAQGEGAFTHKFASGSKVEQVSLDEPETYTLLYEDGELLYLMEMETLEQVEVPKHTIDDEQRKWLQGGIRPTRGRQLRRMRWRR